VDKKYIGYLFNEGGIMM